jgi:serine/threonine-protein kinase
MYSLGSVLYALLARRPPFAAPTMPEVLHALKYDEPPPVRRYAPKTPAELESILNELLEKDPQNRIASPLLLSNRLKAMLHALSEEKEEETDDFVIRLEDDPPPISHQTTMGSGKLEGGSDDATSAPTPTRPMTDARSKEKEKEKEKPRQPRPSDVPTVQSAPTRTFTTVEKEIKPSGDLLPPVEDEGLPLWAMLTAAALLVAVVAGLGWYYMSPPTADARYEKIAAAAEADDPAALANVESQIDQFTALHGDDPRVAEVQGYQQEVSVYRFQRRLEIRARRGPGSSALQPIEQAYLDAMTYERAAPELAAARLQALIDVYGSDKNNSINTRRCVELAKKQLVKLHKRLEESGDEHAKALAGRLIAARSAMLDEPAKAKAICLGIITLYADKPWAANAVAKAKALLSEME